MPSSSADRLISRITALHKSLQLGEGAKLSAMERDLMLGYLRELYELYANQGEARIIPPAPTSRPATAAAPPPAAPAPAPDPVSTPAPPTPAPRVDKVSPPAPAPAPTPPPAPAPAPAAPPTPPPKPAPVLSASNRSLSPKTRNLFKEDDLASPFGRQPVTDLTRALTINNKVLFTRDLFGGDGDLLQTTLSVLNASGAMAAARPVLEKLASQYEWAEEGKAETAREFIELVRRRYA